MSRFQELIAAAQRVSEMEAGSSKTPPGLKAAIGRLRTAVNNVKYRPVETFTVFSGVGTKGEGFVELSGVDLPATMPARAASEIGHNLIEAAATAETEAALLAELRESGVTDEQIGGLLGAMRKRRESKE